MITFEQNCVWAIDQFALQTVLQSRDKPRVRERSEPRTVVQRAHYAIAEHDVVMGCNNRITYERMGGVAIIQLCGIIGKGLDECDEMYGWTDIDKLSEAYVQAVNDPNVMEVLIDIRSPGGQETGVKETSATILAGSARSGGKRTFAWTDDRAQSGAYWVAAQCDVIASAGSAMVGSIGVYCPLVDQSEAWKMQGLKMDLVRSGKFKGAEMSGLPIDEEYRAEVQKRVDAIGVEFRSAITATRPGIQPESMEGLSYRGATAQALGLVDVIYNSIADYHRDIVASRR